MRYLPRRSTASVFLLPFAVLAVSGCSANAPAETAYSARFEEAREAASSDFERQVLEDNTVTRSEYQEATDRFLECVNNAGAGASTAEQAGYFVYDVTDYEVYEQVAPSCSAGSNSLIEPLYVDIYMNPNNVDPDEVLAQCLIAVSAAPDDFSAADLKQIKEQEGGLSTASGPGTLYEDWDLNPATNPDVGGCMENPAQR